MAEKLAENLGLEWYLPWLSENDVFQWIYVISISEYIHKHSAPGAQEQAGWSCVSGFGIAVGICTVVASERIVSYMLIYQQSYSFKSSSMRENVWIAFKA